MHNCSSRTISLAKEYCSRTPDTTVYGPAIMIPYDLYCKYKRPIGNHWKFYGNKKKDIALFVCNFYMFLCFCNSALSMKTRLQWCQSRFCR